MANDYNPCEKFGSQHKSRENKTGQMIQYAVNDIGELFYDQYNEAYARVKSSNHLATCRIRGRDFKILLSRIFWETENNAPSSDVLNSTINVLEAKSRYEGKPYKLHSRVAPDPESKGIWYDLSNEKWQAVHITNMGWEVDDDPPILFRRYKHQRPQDLPERGGDPRLFLKFLNLASKADEDLKLIDTHLKFVPNIPHPAIILYGPQGSAKSTLMILERMLVDPSATDLLILSKNNDELIQQLAHNWTAYYDNVSSLPTWISDQLCRAVTGGGFSKRELYSDDDDVIFNFRRCIGLNGINVAATKPDLLDRSLLIGLKEIDKKNRRRERDIYNEFRKLRPKILGGIFDTLVKAIDLLSSIQVDELPRMADYAYWGCAVAEALGIGQERFLDLYDQNVERQVEEATRSSVVAMALLALMEKRVKWEGSPSELLSELETQADELKINTRTKAWPKAPEILTRRLKELKANFTALGFFIEFDREGKKGRTTYIENLKSKKRGVTGDTGDKGAGDASDATSPTLRPCPLCGKQSKTWYPDAKCEYNICEECHRKEASK